MKRVETLSGKNLPRLAVAKPGWPEPNPITIDALREAEALHGQVYTGSTTSILTRVCDQTEGLRMSEHILTWGELFRDIRGGDMKVAASFLLECAIMISPIVIIVGAILS